MRVLVSIIVSVVAFVMIFVLDKLADSSATSDHVDQVIINVIFGLGLMVGFSWEQAFHSGVAAIELSLQFSEATQPWMQMGMAMLLVGIVTPAWKWYILPQTLAHHHEEPPTGRSGIMSRHGSIAVLNKTRWSMCLIGQDGILSARRRSHAHVD